MAIQSFNLEYTGQIGIFPRTVKILCDDSFSVITAPNYLAPLVTQGYSFLPSDIIEISYANNAFNNFQPIIDGTSITLIPNYVIVPTPQSFTQSIGDGTNPFVTSVADATMNQIGPNLYTVSSLVSWTSKGSAVGTSGLLANLPFIVGATNPRVCATLGFVQNIGFTGSYLIATATSGSDQFAFFGIDNTGVATQVLVSDVGATGQLQLNYTFWTN